MSKPRNMSSALSPRRRTAAPAAGASTPARRHRIGALRAQPIPAPVRWAELEPTEHATEAPSASGWLVSTGYRRW